MADSLKIQTVFFSQITESMYYLLVISAHMFSSIIITTSLLDTLVKIKHQNQFAMDIPGLVSILIYNNSTSSMPLVCNSSHNITSPMDLSNNFLFLNDHGILFLQTSLRNSYYSLDLTLFWSQLTGLSSRQSLSLSMTPSLWTQHVCLSFTCSLNTAFLSMSPLTEAQSLYQTSSILQILLWTYSFTSLQVTTPKVMDKPNIQIRPSSNTSMYIVITNKTTGLNFYFLQSLLTIMLQVLLLVSFYSSLITDII